MSSMRAFPGSEMGSDMVKSKPKRPLTAYNLFFKQERQKIVKTGKAGGFRNLTQAVAERWKSISDEEHSLYVQKAARESNRYKQQMVEWNQSRANVEREKWTHEFECLVEERRIRTMSQRLSPVPNRQHEQSHGGIASGGQLHSRSLPLTPVDAVDSWTLPQVPYADFRQSAWRTRAGSLADEHATEQGYPQPEYRRESFNMHGMMLLRGGTSTATGASTAISAIKGGNNDGDLSMASPTRAGHSHSVDDPWAPLVYTAKSSIRQLSEMDNKEEPEYQGGSCFVPTRVTLDRGTGTTTERHVLCPRPSKKKAASATAESTELGFGDGNVQEHLHFTAPTRRENGNFIEDDPWTPLVTADIVQQQLLFTPSLRRVFEMDNTTWVQQEPMLQEQEECFPGVAEMDIATQKLFRRMREENSTCESPSP